MNTKDVVDIIAVAGTTIILILLLGGDAIVQIIKALRDNKKDD